ncbi:MAG: MarR family transcriptional regulator [Bacteroidales bacterium]|jgi:DNA-binding MarR family transcriptional regulator|nr:MarR family transcriptional regulator [Bacteroidales bacterium]
MEYDQLKLDNQLCFPVYAASRLIIREYQPYLDELGITYPQYLVLMVLWEHDGIPVNDIAKKLILNTNTITPLLKRMESMELLSRVRSSEDERKVIIVLTDKGSKLKEKACDIPTTLMAKLLDGSIDVEELKRMKNLLTHLIDMLT